ncbi:MAG: multicopper oxidase, partial [Frankiales bacterium]|nr:multicopper oxidase [Frankiales bacterium]
MTSTRSHVPSGGSVRRWRRVAVTFSLTGVTAWAVAVTPAVAVAPQAPTLARAAAPAVPAAAVGKLTPRGCSTSAGVASCDLYAKAGTTQILGADIPIWGFATTDAALATAPGPLLVVRQGDAVTVTLHNDLAGESVGLAFPGQTGVTGAGVLGDDVTGVPAGSTRSYSFTASRPGTFLYEAGHTDNGARQTAMGLAGALVVLSSDATAYGTPQTAYDDDAVLVLSEIDPALNAAPATFDMRQWRPKYRLLNGKSFPETDTIPTNQGRKVLLRYINAGADMHPLTVLGRNQVEVAVDGHLAQFTSTIATEAIKPGETVDTIVTMPTGPESKLAVYEPSQHANNNSQHTADPQQLAFGGMIAFLDTNAPLPDADHVGPVPASVALSDPTTTGAAPVTVSADLDDTTTGGHNVTDAEYVIDDPLSGPGGATVLDVGPGFGVPMTGGTFGAVSVTHI